MDNKSSGFLKNNLQLIYSIVLLIIIPGAIVGNSYLALRESRQLLDRELQQKAVFAETIFNVAVADFLDDKTALQTKIETIMAKDSEVKEINVLKFQNDQLKVLASSNKESLGVTLSSQVEKLNAMNAWINEVATATLVADNSTGKLQRYWVVVSPLYDGLSEKKAIVEMKGSLEEIDALAKKSLSSSMIILIITVIIVLALLVYHFRFVEYAALYRRLLEVDQMKDDFISIASHELKTPMAAIKGYLSMIFEGLGGKVDQKARGHLDKAFANVKRLDNLVNELLDVSRIEQGRIQFEMQAIDPVKVVEQIISELKVKADEKKLKIEYHPPAEPRPKIFVDPDRLGQILDNIIGNAIKYTLKGGITISHQIESSNLKIFIRDTGIGMNALDRQRLFEKFYRIQNEKTAAVPGTGLGLWITRELAHKMNAEIFVDSMENVGSQFTLVFPIIKEK